MVSKSSKRTRDQWKRRRSTAFPTLPIFGNGVFLLFLLLLLLIVTQPVCAEDGNSVTIPPFFDTPTGAPIAPTPAPVLLTDPPTLSPTKNPSQSPTKTPTLAPTTAPTLAPTTAPTESPTKQPTAPPTTSPTLAPTNPPTLSPTQRPSTSPSKSPAPTTFTAAPTISPKPTNAPTTLKPTLSPTTPPTPTPTNPPTFATTSFRTNVVLRLESKRQKLTGSTVVGDFERTTVSHIDTVLERLTVAQTTEFTTIRVDIYDQAEIRGRFLQSTSSNNNSNNAIRVGCNVDIFYKGPPQSNAVQTSWVQEPFNSDVKLSSYLDDLKQTNPAAFGEISSIRVWVNDKEVNDNNNNNNGSGGSSNDNNNNQSSNDNSTVWIYVAAAGGILACLVGLTCLYCLRRRSKQQQRRQEHGRRTTRRSKKQHPSNGLSTKKSEDSTNNYQFAAEIEVNHRPDDISTLGDPVYGNHIATDEKTASIGADYDYRGLLGQQFSNSIISDPSRSASTNITNFSKPLGTGDVFADEGSFEDQFLAEKRLDVHVPPGRLGMVIDTPNGGPPVVHAVKPDSVLSNKVTVGDLLLSVDGQDVTELTAVQVSKLISMRADQHRILVFVRNVRGRTSSMESSVLLEEGAC